MLRFVAYLLIAILLISVLRAVIGVVMKGLADVFGPSQQRAERRANFPTGGELKKDPVCGTYIAIDSAVQKTMGGETYYFCSPACRDKFPLQRTTPR